MTVRELMIKLMLDSSNAKKELEQTQKGLDGVTQSTGKVEKGAGQAGAALKNAAEEGKSSWEGLKGTIAGVLGAIGAAELTQGFLEDTARIDKFSNMLGMSVEQWQGWESACQSAGIEAEGFGTRIADLGDWITDLNMNDGGALKDFSEHFGVSFKDASGASVDLEEGLMRILDVTEKMNNQEATSLLTNIGFDDQTIPLLLKGRQGIEELVKAGKESAIYSQKDINVANRLREAWANVTNTIKKLAAVVIGMLGPAFTWIAEKTGAIAKYVTANGESVARIISVVAVALGATLVPKIYAAAKALKVMTAASKPMLAFVAVIAAIALAFDDLMTYAEGGESALEDVWKVFGSPEEIKAAIEEVKQFGRDLITAIEPLLPYVGKAFKFIGQTIIAVLVGIAKFIKDPMGTIESITASCAEFLTSVFEKASEAVESALDSIASAVSPVTTAISKAFSTAADAVAAAWDGVVSFFNSVGNAISKAFSGPVAIFDTVIDAAGAVGNAISKAFSGPVAIFDTVIDAAGAVGNAISSAFSGDFSGIAEGVAGLLGSIKKGLSNVAGGLLGKASNAVSSFLRLIGNGVQKAAAMAGGFADSFVQTVSGIAPALGNIASAAFNTISSVFSNLASLAKDPLGNIEAVFSTVFNGAVNIVGSAVEAIADVTGAVVNTISAGWQGIMGVFNAVGGVINSVVEIYKRLFTGDFGGIVSGLNSVSAAFSAVGNAVKAVLDWAQQKISSILGMLSSGIASVVGGIGGAISSVKNFFSSSDGGGSNVREATTGSGGGFGAGASAKAGNTTTTNNKNVTVSNHNNITVQTQATDSKGIARDIGPALNQNQTAQADVAFGA